MIVFFFLNIVINIVFSLNFFFRIASKSKSDRNDNEGMLKNTILFRRSDRKKRHVLDEEDVDYDDSTQPLNEEHSMEESSLNKVTKHSVFSKTGQPLMLQDNKHSGDLELLKWKSNFHFASFPLYDFGNWIPFVMARWPCLGTGCGLPQVAFKNSKGTKMFLHDLHRQKRCRFY